MSIRAVVINRRDNPARLEAFRASYAASGWASLLGEVDVFEAVEGIHSDYWTSWPVGTWGCWASHLAVIAQAVDDRIDELFVFEDDAVFAPDSVRGLHGELALASGRPLWLGGEQHGGRCYRTHAYSLPLATMRRLLPRLAREIGPVDISLATLLGPVDRAKPWLVGQAAGRSDITNQDNPERWWNGGLECP